MNAVLREILETKQVRDAAGTVIPLRAAMTEEEGALIGQVFHQVKPDASLEIGFAFGISTLFACEALKDNGNPCRHIVVDPNQSTRWQNVGLENIKRAGFAPMVEFMEMGSELALPRLLGQGTRIQAAIIDGWHTFDHALVDFFYVNKMLDVGGAVIIDDTIMPSLARLVAHIATYPAYRVMMASSMPHAPNPMVTLRRWFNGTGRSTRHTRDNPYCIVFQKVAEDTRDWGWHADF